MIAASDPQEYLPRGRQQALRHPGPRETPTKNLFGESDEFVLNKLEKVSLVDAKPTEWWTLRKANASTNMLLSEDQDHYEASHKSSSHLNSFQSQYSDFADESSCPEISLNKFGKRMSDANSNKTSHKRFSVDNEQKNESKCSGDSKSQFFNKHPQNLLMKAKSDPTYIEEELYVKGHVVVWSRGLVNNFDGLDNGRKTVGCYTLPLPVKQALWCTFYCERPVFNEDLVADNKIDKPSGIPVEAICVTDSHNIKVFTPKGEDFSIAVPFNIGKIWSTNYGVFIEKEYGSFPKESVYETPANLFSLSYPLDNICPVAVNQSGTLSVMNCNSQVVFTSKYPSICMVFDMVSKQHSIYRIRKLRPDEQHFTTNSSLRLKSRLSMWDNFGNTRNAPLSSPVSSKIGGVANVGPSRPQSSMAMMSRCQSPSASSYGGSPWQNDNSRHKSALRTPVTSRSYFDYSKTVSYLKSTPTICLDHVWSENYCLQDSDTAAPASKVFLTDDFVDQWYLCYMLTSRCQLSIVKIYFISDINFGISTSISAKDAIPIPHLHMLAILEHSGNVCLYSGLSLIGKLHIGGTLAQHTPSPFVKRNVQHYSHFSPFPRRSSLLPHLHADPMFEEHLLSPVLPMSSIPSRNPNLLQSTLSNRVNHKSRLIGLIDAIENRLTLKYSDGTFYRITLPSLALTSLVERCLTTLRHILPREVALVLFSRWYAGRNVIGAQNITRSQEWNMFTTLLLELLGYEDEQISDNSTKDIHITPSLTKRQKYCAGTDQDWNYFLLSNHKAIAGNLNRMLKLNIDYRSEPEVVETANVNPKSILFPYFRTLHFSLHLLYEDMKLNMLHSDDLLPLMQFLNKLSIDMELKAYNLHYWKDFPEHATLDGKATIPQTELKNIYGWLELPEKPVSVMDHIYQLLMGEILQPFPYMSNVNNRSKNIVQICGVLYYTTSSVQSEVLLDSFVKPVDATNLEGCSQENDRSQGKKIIVDSLVTEQVVLLMVDMKINTSYLDTLPFGIYFLFYNTLWKFRENPPSNWPAEAYYLLSREDLAAQALKTEKEKHESSQELLGMYSSTQLEDVVPGIKADSEQLDGMEEIDNSLMKLRFNEDARVNEARKMLQSSKPVPIILTQRPDVSDHDFIEEQEKHLYGICIRTMALPVGRGMFTLRTATPVITEPLPAPPLCLTGKAPPRGTTVDLNHIDTPTNMNLWPLFHNGVANGLRIIPDAHNIDNTWIILNKSKGGSELQIEHAGFLLALGLNGHLKNLAFNNTFNYLEKIHEMTSVGILLGLSAAFRGTCHSNLTKTLAIHIEALLPPTSMELDIPQTLQVAALLGIGLVYQGTSQRHMTEVLLSEIGRPPGPEMENSVDRESYSLAAGLALGLLTLKHGNRPTGLSDLNVADTLHYYMVGGNKRPLTGSQKDKYKTSSFQIREGSSVNLDVTAPGATLALGLMYLGTANKAVADWMAPPETQYLLDFVRPDFLLLRILARSLILWNDIKPTKEWVEGQVPPSIKVHCMVPLHVLDIDYEAMNQAYCNIVAGACFALGLRYAGTADKNAFETLLYFCQRFASLTAKSIAELAGKSTIETCLNVLLLSAAMVMAGTGNLEIIRLVRHLRRRVGVSNSPVVTYGSHLAIHMALGLLFLGGGRYTLSNSPSSVAALICAFYPKFPTHSNDNRYHLQAFRHLYVLAVEPRLVIPKEIHLDEICYANIKIVELNGNTFNIKGPGLIPDLNTLIKVAVDDERYWPVVFERSRNWDLLEKILSTTGCIEVKQRAGCLSYIADQFGYHSQLAKTLTHSAVVPWDPSPNSIIQFTSDKSIKLFCKHFLKDDKTEHGANEARMRHALSKITYDAVVRDKIIVIVVYICLFKAIAELENSPNSFNLWQFKIITRQILSNKFSSLLSKEVILALRQEVVGIFNSWEASLRNIIKNYILGKPFREDGNSLIQKKLSAYVVFFDIPHNMNFSQCEYLETLVKLHSSGFSTETVQKILEICDIR